MLTPSRLKPIFISALMLLASGCSFFPGETSSPPTPTMTQSPTLTQRVFPDLAFTSMRIEPADATQSGPASTAECPGSDNPLGIRAWIKNAGLGPAGPFKVELNGVLTTVEGGLLAGESLAIWVEGYERVNSLIIDVADQVEESDENNNQVAIELQQPTTSPECQPTPQPASRIIKPLATLSGHSAKVWQVDFSPDGKLLASASVDNTLRLWQVEQARLLRTMRGHPFPILSVAFSPSGASLATGSDDGLIRIWQVSNGSLTRTLEGHGGWVRDLDYSPEGRLLVSGSDDFTVRIWRLLDGKLLYTIDEGMEAVSSVSFSPDGQLVAWGESDGTLRVWEISTETWLNIIDTGPESIKSVAFSPDGKLLACGSDDGQVRIWSVEEGDLLQTLDGHTGSVTSLDFSPNGNMLATGSGDKTIRIWGLNPPSTAEQSAQNESQETQRIPFEKIPKAILIGHTSRVNTVTFSPNGKLLASGSDDMTIDLWQVPEG
jgi:WD40 repeat protein